VLATSGRIARVRSAVLLVIAVSGGSNALTGLTRVSGAGIVGRTGLVNQRASASGRVTLRELAIVIGSAMGRRGALAIGANVVGARIVVVAHGNLGTAYCGVDALTRKRETRIRRGNAKALGDAHVRIRIAVLLLTECGGCARAGARLRRMNTAGSRIAGVRGALDAVVAIFSNGDAVTGLALEASASIACRTRLRNRRARAISSALSDQTGVSCRAVRSASAGAAVASIIGARIAIVTY